MPLPRPGAFWYSFDFGPVHFLQYSTEVPFDAASEQYRCSTQLRCAVQHEILMCDPAFWTTCRHQKSPLLSLRPLRGLFCPTVWSHLNSDTLQ